MVTEVVHGASIGDRVAIDRAVAAGTGLIGGGAGALIVGGVAVMCTGRRPDRGGHDRRCADWRGRLDLRITSCLGRNILTGAGGALSKVTGVARYGCFTADTPVLMADDQAHRRCRDRRPGRR